ncbi:hypothetical protein AND_007250 [Anopheles darlingi]|uniref:Ig-like domain-containing protein n=1 Tax=Anopheles darlingi TaxID=43151 RepID=W5JE60_ANODA|nr:hypothetical protein AND_007250 [Anopheles darlingi]
MGGPSTHQHQVHIEAEGTLIQWFISFLFVHFVTDIINFLHGVNIGIRSTKGCSSTPPLHQLMLELLDERFVPWIIHSEQFMLHCCKHTRVRMIVFEVHNGSSQRPQQQRIFLDADEGPSFRPTSPYAVRTPAALSTIPKPRVQQNFQTGPAGLWSTSSKIFIKLLHGVDRARIERNDLRDAFATSGADKRWCSAQQQQQKFKVKPTDLLVAEGSEAVLRCEILHAAGAVQWTKDGEVLGYEESTNSITGYPRYSIEREGGGAGGVYNLHIANVTLDDDDHYECQVHPFMHHKPIRAKARLTVIAVNGGLMHSIQSFRVAGMKCCSSWCPSLTCPLSVTRTAGAH